MRFWLVPLTLVALVVGSGALMVVLDIELAQLFGNPRRALFQAMASVGIAGLAGSVLSVLAAPRLALWQSQGRRIENASNKQESALLEAVTRLAAKAGLHAPQLVIFPGEPNAFCVGLTRNRALLAVSDGLLYSLGRRETEAVLAHEIAHIANGDMLTLELAQGVLSLLVLWPALAMDALSRRLQGQGRRTRRGIAYSVTYLTCMVLFGSLAGLLVAWFSRRREYRADRAVRALTGEREHLSSALGRLATLRLRGMYGMLAAAGIVGERPLFAPYASHPGMDKRLTALKKG